MIQCTDCQRTANGDCGKHQPSSIGQMPLPVEIALARLGWRYRPEKDDIICVGCGKALGGCGHPSPVF